MSLLKTLHCFPLKRSYSPVGLHCHDLFFLCVLLKRLFTLMYWARVWARSAERGAGP